MRCKETHFNTHKKLKKKVVVTFILSAIAVVLCMAYFVLVYPMLSFMVNSVPQNISGGGASAVPKGENVLDMSQINISIDISGGDSNGGEGSGESNGGNTGNSGSSSGGGSSSSVPYAPDPIVSGVTKTSGKNLKFEPDAHNILVLGQDVKSGLADTIMIISICDRLNTVQVASISRDAYVPYSRTVVDAINSKGYGRSAGIYKINASLFIGNYVVNYQDGIFDNQGINFMCSILKELLPDSNCEIDEYVFMNRDGFIEIVDVVGGIDVYVTEDFYNGNGQLMWKKGYNYMTGRDCLTYVTRRYRYNADGQISSTGDPYRKANQLSFMRDFALQIVTVENIPKFPDIMNSLSRNVWHSFNNASDISKYSGCALKFAKSQYKMSMYVVTGRSFDPVGDGASYVNLMS